MSNVQEPDIQEMPQPDEPEAAGLSSEEFNSLVLQAIWKYLIGVVVLTVLITIGMVKFSGISHKVIPNVVSFDVIKYTNAQRKVLSNNLMSNKSDDTAILLGELSSKTKAVLEKHAGPNTIIVVKQAVVNSVKVQDITDEVLTELGLPTDVPSVLPQIASAEKLTGTFEEFSKLGGETQLRRPQEISGANSKLLP